MQLTEQISVALGTDERERLEAIAKLEEVSIGLVVRDTIELGLPAVKAAYARGEVNRRRPYRRGNSFAQLRFMLLPDERAALEDLAAEHEIVISQVVRDAIIRGLPAREARSEATLRERRRRRLALAAALTEDLQFSSPEG